MIETFNLLHDWSKWLITLETAICVGLWSKLTSAPELTVASRPSALLYVGWMMFMASIVTATLLVVVIAFAMRRVNESGESGAEDLKRVRVLVVIEYGFFLTGVTCFVWRMFQVWAP